MCTRLTVYSIGNARRLGMQECYDNARAQDPKLAAIWEAMAAFTALPTAHAAEGDLPPLLESTELYKHALGLGGGAEADLGFAYGALRSPGFPQALAYAAAHRAAPMQPLNPVVYHTLALVLENAGASASASRLLRVAAGLLERAGPGLTGAQLACAPILLPPHDASGAGLARGAALTRAVQLDLARSMVKAGDYEGGVEVYSGLDAGGALGAHAMAAYALALLSAGQAERAHGVMVRAVEGASSVLEAAKASLMLVRGTAQASGARAAGETAHALAATLRVHASPPCDEAPLWLAVLAAAATEGDAPTLAGAQDALAALLPELPAEEAADVALAGCATAKTTRCALRCALRAVHLCPWSPVHRSVAVRIAAGGAAAPTAGRLLVAPQPAQALPVPVVSAAEPAPSEGTEGGYLGSDDWQGSGASAAAIASRGAALPDGEAAAAEPSLRRAVRGAYARVHAAPAALAPWYQLALLLTQRAMLSPAPAQDSHASVSAAAACAHALALLDRLKRRGAEPHATAVRVHLLLARSVADITGAHAMPCAQGALAAGAGGPLAGACYRQVAACHLAAGGASAAAAAEAALRQGADVGDAACVCLLSQLLADQGRHAEAVAQLQDAAAALVHLHADATHASPGLGEYSDGEGGGEWRHVGAVGGGAAWLGALRLREVALLCSWDDVERAKAAMAGVSLEGSDAAIASTFLASALLRGAGAASGALAEVRATLRSASARSGRRDVRLAGAIVGAEAELARGRGDTATAALRVCAKQATRAGISNAPATAGAAGLSAPVLTLRSWAPGPEGVGR